MEYERSIVKERGREGFAVSLSGDFNDSTAEFSVSYHGLPVSGGYIVAFMTVFEF